MISSAVDPSGSLALQRPDAAGASETDDAAKMRPRARDRGAGMPSGFLHDSRAAAIRKMQEPRLSGALTLALHLTRTRGQRLPPASVASPSASPMRTPVVSASPIRTPVVSEAWAAPVGIRGVIREGTPKSRRVVPVIVGIATIRVGVIASRVVGRWWSRGSLSVRALLRVGPEIGRACSSRR